MLARIGSQLPLRTRPHGPVFIIGCARSGTSVLRRVIGRHPQVAAYPSEGNELWHPGYYPWISSDRTTPPLWYAPARFTEASLAAWPKSHVDRLRRSFGLYQGLSRRPVFVNKSSMINFMLPRVLELFPDARFIHIVRDGRAVAYSYAVKEYAKLSAKPELYRDSGIQMTFDEMLERMAHFWIETLGRIQSSVSALQLADHGRYMECRYEAFCHSPAATTDEIFAFLDLTGAPQGPGEAIRNRNEKYRSALHADMQARLACILRETLPAYGYAEGQSQA
jgi:hypothetical protein